MTDWVAALESVRQPSSDKLEPGEVFLDELQVKWNLSYQQANRYARRLVEAGMATVAQRKKRGKLANAYKLLKKK
jgi:hypothetical protein